MNANSASPSTSSTDVMIRIAGLADLPEVLRIQREGFRRVAAKAGVPDDLMPPVAETLDALRELHAAGVRTFLASAFERGREVPAGTVRATERADGVVEIGRLAVADGFTRLGIATALMLALEADFPATVRFELFTGADATEPLALYARMGYSIFAREQFEGWSMVWLAKARTSATATAGAPLD